MAKNETKRRLKALLVELGLIDNPEIDLRTLEKEVKPFIPVVRESISHYRNVGEISREVVEEAKKESTIKSLPSSIVKKEGTDIVLTRISSVLSQNKARQAVVFVEGVKNLLSGMEKGSRLFFEAIGGKNKISTQLFRNPYAFGVLKAIKKALSRGINVFIRNRDGSLSTIDLPTLYKLYSEGISISVTERSEVYDGLFATKWNGSHYNQFLQWSFGLALRDPEIEFSVLLNKYGKLVIDKSDAPLRLESAIRLLSKKRQLFDLDEEGLETAIEKMKHFHDLVMNFSSHKEVQKRSRMLQVQLLLEKLSEDERKELLARFNSQ